MTDSRSVGDVLMEAAAQLDEHGWCVDTVEDKDGRMCALGALNKVLEGNAFAVMWNTAHRGLHVACRQALLRVKGKENDLGYGVASINNHQIKDKQEAVEWFQKAAANSGLTLKEKQ